MLITLNYTDKLLINKIFIDFLIIFIISTISLVNDVGNVHQIFFYHYYYYTLLTEYYPPIILLLFNNFLILYIDHDYGLQTK